MQIIRNSRVRRILVAVGTVAAVWVAAGAPVYPGM